MTYMCDVSSRIIAAPQGREGMQRKFFNANFNLKRKPQYVEGIDIIIADDIEDMYGVANHQ